MRRNALVFRPRPWIPACVGMTGVIRAEWSEDPESTANTKTIPPLL